MDVRFVHYWIFNSLSFLLSPSRTSLSISPALSSGCCKVVSKTKIYEKGLNFLNIHLSCICCISFLVSTHQCCLLNLSLTNTYTRLLAAPYFTVPPSNEKNKRIYSGCGFPGLPYLLIPLPLSQAILSTFFNHAPKHANTPAHTHTHTRLHSSRERQRNGCGSSNFLLS